MTIFLVGGGDGADDGGFREVWDAFAATARERGRLTATTRVVLCLLGSAETVAAVAPSYADPIAKRWPEATFEVVNLADDEISWPDWASVAAVMVGGGHTPSYLAALQSQRDVLARLVRQDLPYFGNSAGASITARHALIGGRFHGGLRVQQDAAAEDLDPLTVVDGLAMITPLVQVHTDAWSNEGAVITALEAGLAQHAVSIDEDTCLVVDPLSGRTARLGVGRLRWFSKEADGGVFVRTDEPEAVAPPAADGAVEGEPNQQ